MQEHLYNGKQQDIHDNVIFIKGSLNNLEKNINRLVESVDKLVEVQETNYKAQERIIVHIQNSIPVKFMILICLIICIAFVGGGVLKELIDSHVISKLLL